jgi:hypothetical protein
VAAFRRARETNCGYISFKLIDEAEAEVKFGQGADFKGKKVVQ